MLGKATSGKAPREALETIIASYLRQSPLVSQTDLCPLAMLGLELKHAEDHTRDLAMLGFQRFVALIEAELVKLGKPQAKMLATGMGNTLVGAVTLASVTPHKATAKKVLKDTLEYVLRNIN